MVVSLVYFGTTLGLRHFAGLPFPAAIAVGVVVALALHFQLQRRFVFRGREFALSGAEQARRYAVLATAQWAVASAATSLLPDVLGVSTEIVYVGVTVVLSVTIFLLLRARIFHVEAAPPPSRVRPGA